MISLVKMSFKLLLRNKGFLFFLLMTPILSAVCLSIKTEHTVYSDNSNKNILDLKNYKEKAVYVGDTSTCIVKVYDASNSKLSEYVLNQIVDTGMFSVCRADVSGVADKEIEENAKRTAFDDRTGMLLYLKEDFDEAILSGNWEKGLKLYDVSEDERKNIFITELTDIFARIKKVQEVAGNDTEIVLEGLEKMQQTLPEKKLVNLAGKESVELTQKQVNQHTQIGYAFAFITLGFLFCGVCVSHSVIEEQNNRVFTRIMMTKKNIRDYFVSKFIIALIISIMQTGVLAICILCIPKLDVGIGIVDFLLIIFLLGLIFSTISMLIGVILGDVMSSNYAVFTIWSISALLAGLYFPLEDTTKALNTISYLMPQRWFMDASKLLIVGDKSAYFMVLCVTVAYLIVFISVGGVGLKIKKYE